MKHSWTNSLNRVLQLRVRNSCVEGREVKCFNTIAGGEWLKIKLYLLGIAARPTEKLAAQNYFFSVSDNFFY